MDKPKLNPLQQSLSPEMRSHGFQNDGQERKIFLITSGARTVRLVIVAASGVKMRGASESMQGRFAAMAQGSVLYDIPSLALVVRCSTSLALADGSPPTRALGRVEMDLLSGRPSEEVRIAAGFDHVAAVHTILSFLTLVFSCRPLG